MAVVTVQDGGLGYAFVGGAVEDREELALGLEVLLKSAVKVEMLRREIGEDRDVDLRAPQLPERQRVAGRLEHAPGPARDEKLGEELLHLDSFLRALTGLVLPLVVRDLEVHRRREPRLGARRLENVGDQVDGRGLAVGAGDGRELQLAGRVIEELGRYVGERGSRVRDDRDRDGDVDRMFRHDGHRAARDCVLREDVSVAMKTRDRDEECGFFGLARVVGDLADVDGRRVLGDGDLCRFKEGAKLQRRIRPTRRSAAV